MSATEIPTLFDQHSDHPAVRFAPIHDADSGRLPQDKELSDAALDQGWGWRPPENIGRVAIPSEVVAVPATEVIEEEIVPEPKLPTDEERVLAREKIATLRERIRNL